MAPGRALPVVRTRIWVGGAAIVLAVVLGVVLLLQARVEEAMPGSDGSGVAAHEERRGGTSGRQAQRADASGAARGPAERLDRAGVVSAGRDDAGAASGGSSLVEQLIAIHSIASQVDVSAFLERNAELAAKHIDQYCNERKRLSRSPLGEGGRSRDAAAFLAPRIDWTTTPPRFGLLHLPDALTDKLGAAGDRWPEAITDGDLSALDFEWMRALAEFDHWSLLGAGPLAGSETPDLESTLPNYVMLSNWSKLRLARGLRFGDVLEASREVRHLADLLHSQAVLIAQMIAVRQLRLEREAYEAALRQGRSVEGWAPAAVEDLDRLRRLDRSGFSFFFPGVDPAIMDRALACVPSLCVALNEAAWAHASIGELTPDGSEGFWALASEHGGCDPALLLTIRRGKSMTPEHARSVFQTRPILEELFGPAP